MKLLFDQNISYRIEKILSDYFNECRHVSSLNLMNEADINIWEFALKENFTIVTFDADFYDFSLFKGCPPKIIWIKTGNLTTKKLAKTLIDNILLIKEFAENPLNKDIACLQIN